MQVNFQVCIVSTIFRGVLKVLLISTGESLSPTQILTTTHNSMSSLDVKRCFEVMAIKHCCEVTTQLNVFKFSGNDAETPL